MSLRKTLLPLSDLLPSTCWAAAGGAGEGAAGRQVGHVSGWLVSLGSRGAASLCPGLCGRGEKVVGQFGFQLHGAQVSAVRSQQGPSPAGCLCAPHQQQLPLSPAPRATLGWSISLLPAACCRQE